MKYRLRLIDITPEQRGASGLVAQPVLARTLPGGGEGWRGPFPPALAVERQWRQMIYILEAYDFELEHTTEGDLRLHVLRPVDRTWDGRGTTFTDLGRRMNARRGAGNR